MLVELELAPIILKLHISYSLSCRFALASMLNFSLSQYHFFLFMVSILHYLYIYIYLLSRSTFFFCMFISVFFVFFLPYIIYYLNDTGHMPYDKLSSEVVQYLVFSELFTLTFVVLIHDTIYLIVPTRNRHHLSSLIALRRWKLSPSILLSPRRRAVVTLLASPIVWVTRRKQQSRWGKHR